MLIYSQGLSHCLGYLLIFLIDCIKLHFGISLIGVWKVVLLWHWSEYLIEGAVNLTTKYFLKQLKAFIYPSCRKQQAFIWSRLEPICGHYHVITICTKTLAVLIYALTLTVLQHNIKVIHYLKKPEVLFSISLITFLIYYIVCLNDRATPPTHLCLHRNSLQST